jgi:hypothetical protein
LDPLMPTGFGDPRIALDGCGRNEANLRANLKAAYSWAAAGKKRLSERALRECYRQVGKLTEHHVAAARRLSQVSNAIIPDEERVCC